MSSLSFQRPRTPDTPNRWETIEIDETTKMVAAKDVLAMLAPVLRRSTVGMDHVTKGVKDRLVRGRMNGNGGHKLLGDAKTMVRVIYDAAFSCDRQIMGKLDLPYQASMLCKHMKAEVDIRAIDAEYAYKFQLGELSRDVACWACSEVHPSHPDFKKNIQELRKMLDTLEHAVDARPQTAV